MVLFHAHEGSVRVCFTATASLGPDYFFLLRIFIECRRPLLAGVVQLLFYLRIYRLVFEGIVYLLNGPAYFFTVYFIEAGGVGIIQFRGSYALRILPQLI